MKRSTTSALIGAAAGLSVVAAAFLAWKLVGPRPVTVALGKLPEQLVYVRSADDIINAGTIFMPPNPTRPVAVIWIHGWGVNFYYPTYVGIGRALAGRGCTSISANTRMHDLGTVAGYRGEKRIRGGGYWGVASEEVRDLAAWIDFAETQGFGKVVLVGHSAGWAAVRRYQAERQDPRVVGVVLASGAVRAETTPPDPDQLAEAKRLMAAGEGDALIRDPKRSFPSYTSATTVMDIANAPPEFRDFFGALPETANPGITRIRCPLLAFFGTRGDVGNEKDLELLKTSVRRQRTGPSRVDTALIRYGDHMYTGEEEQVAGTIANWIDGVVLPQSPGGGSGSARPHQ